MIIRDWTVKRSGASLTIDGVDDETGDIVKITGVTHVNGPRRGYIRTIAYRPNGNPVVLKSGVA